MTLWKATALFLLFSISVLAYGQDTTDTTEKVKKPFKPLQLTPHSPANAAFYAAIVPGLGQVYNRKYWKVPIVYLGIGVSTYSMLYNRSKKRKLDASFREAYKIKADTSIDVAIIAKRDQYRRYRDISILAMSAFYILQIIDATVDAHFYKFDINQNLQASFRASPAQWIAFTYTF